MNARNVASWRLGATFVFVGWFVASAAIAEPVRISVSVSSSEPVPVEVVAEALVARTGESGPRAVSRSLKAPAEVDLDLDLTHPWRVSIRSSEHWSPEAIVPPLSDPAPLRFALLPTTQVSGRVIPPKGDAAPDEITLRFESPEGTSISVPRDEISCPIQDGGWSCRIPAGTLDLRARSKGFVSHYFWAVDLSSGEPHDLGRLRLVRGASMVGRVEVAAPRWPEHLPVVILEPRRGGLAVAETGARLGRLGMTERPNRKGFFHFEGVPAGEYLVRAELEGFAPATHPVRVFENAESALNEPLVLRPPVPLEVFLDPPLDPSGEPWRIGLAEVGETPGVMTEVTGTPEGADPGYWRKEGLSPGAYMIRILSSEGVGFAMVRLLLDEASPPVEIEIPAVEIEGRLFLGDDPLRGRLSFGGKHGMVKVEMEADEEGRFGGILPRPGDWRVDVEAEDPHVFRRLAAVEVEREGGGRPAEVEIRLPGGRLFGDVVGENGRPVPGAVVEVASATVREVPSYGGSDADGGFSFAGMAPGLYVATAEGEGSASDPIHVRLGEDGGSRVRLVVREMNEIQGAVVSGTHGVPAARVRAKPVLGDAVPVSLSSVLTDAEGRFSQRLPGWVREVEITVSAPGFDLTQVRLPVDPDEAIVLPVTQLGGTLQLRWEPWPEAEMPPVLFGAAGLPWTLSLLDGWAASVAGRPPGMAGPGPSGGVLTVPRVEPGTYVFCWFSDLRQLSVARASGVWPSGRCDRGTLTPFGQLVLEARPPR